MKYRIITNTKDSKLTREYLELLAPFTESVSSDEVCRAECEIVLGKTNRAISEKAEALLKESLDNEVGYAVLAEGSSIAAVWSDFRMEEAAVKHIAENISKIKDAYSFSESFALMPYLKARGENRRNEMWDKFKKYLGDDNGEEIVSAFKELYSLFTSELAVWHAGLYDHEHGGFYWSNSARDTIGYLPDIEDTYTSIFTLWESGMSEMLEPSERDFLPESVKKKIGNTIRNLQDEDGFFYHPQWPKEYIIENKRQSRIMRDRNSALWVLRHLGIEPKYELPKPTDTQGSENSSVAPEYASVDSFRACLDKFERDYLATEDADRRAYLFYYYGNFFQSARNHIAENPEFVKMLLEFFEKHQNEKTGLWSDVITYNATNGLHKIANIYNFLGAELKHVDKMVDTAMEILCLDAEKYPVHGPIAIYNVWSCFPYIYENIVKYGKGTEEERRAKKDAIKKRVLALAPTAIKTAYKQIEGLRCEDGSFRGSRFVCSFSMQDCPCAVPDTIEGSSDGNNAATHSLKHHIFKALEAEEYEVPIFSEYERMLYMNTINELIENGSKEKSKAGFKVITNVPDGKILGGAMKLLSEKIDITDVCDDNTERVIREVVIGDTSRDVSKITRKKLDAALEGADGDTVGFAITNNRSIGIVCSDVRLLEAACEHFVKYYPAVDTVKTFSMSEYLKERDVRVKEKKWNAFKEYLGESGESVVEEFKKLYSLFDEKNIKWLANLYDPERGAWYLSNSGRDIYGYLPSIEVSYGVLCFFSLSGMAEMVEGSSSNILTPEMKDKLAEFIISKQDEDTYFYHPQWPKEFILDNNYQPRITRDKGSALWMLSVLKREPKYKDLPKAEEGEKKSEAPKMLAQFESVESFREYLAALESDYLALDTPEKRAYQFYVYGNLFQSTTGYINANPEFKRMLLEFFGKYQNEDTGTWSEVVNFDAVNGLHKIACIYNAIGARLNLVEKAIDTTMKLLSVTVEEKPAQSYIEVYNVWSVFPYIYKNVVSFGDGSEEERLQKKEEIKRRVFAAAPEAIRASYGQVAGLRRADGAFSSRGGTAPFHMGCPIALPGLYEGTDMSIYSLTHHIFMALEAEEYEIPYCTEYHRAIFSEELNKVIARGPVKKVKAQYRIISNTPEDKTVLKIAERLGEVVEVTGIYTDEEPRQVLEIVIGDTAREISKSSRARLDKALEGKEDHAGFSIHSVGSIGITYTDLASLEAAIDHFVRLFPAVNTVKTFPRESFLKERGERIKKEKWAKVESALGRFGKDIVNELKDLYSLFNDNAVKWLAGLYDPEIGGFYACESGRDHLGYYPDIESTIIALTYISSSGMAELYNGDFSRALPDWMPEKLTAFADSLQDEDSFFYHPHWPKEYITENNKQSRITRDRGSGTRVLNAFGKVPRYKEAAVKKTEGKRMLEQFESIENFKRYLERLDADIAAMDEKQRAFKFYSLGNDFQSTTPYLNANPDMKAEFIAFIEKHQSEKSGLWTDLFCYDATNALHKIGAVANRIGYGLKHVDKMIDTVFEILSSSVEEMPAPTSVTIYNAWSCFPYIYENVLKYGEGTEEERKARKAAIKERVLKEAARLIHNSIEHTRGFEKPGGIFGSLRTATSGKDQGCPIAPRGVMEGGVNSHGTASTALKHHIFMALELTELEPPLYTEYERYLFVSELEKVRERGSVKKKKTSYRLVSDTMNAERDKKIADALCEVLDIVEITDNSTERTALEITVGESNRPSYETVKQRLSKALEAAPAGSRGFAVIHEGTISIAYSDEQSLFAAVDWVATHFPAADKVKIFQ